MTDKRKITKIFILITVLAVIIFDVWVYLTGGVDSTISRITWNWSTNYPPIVFAVGFVCGHLFWAQKIKDVN